MECDRAAYTRAAFCFLLSFGDGQRIGIPLNLQPLHMEFKKEE